MSRTSTSSDKGSSRVSRSSGKGGLQRASNTSHDSDVTEEKSEVERPWKFTQWFKKNSEDSLPDSDLLSAVEFDGTGEFLATGDRGGRIVVLRADPDAKPGKVHYKFHCEFQSHEVDFDYVRSQTIEEKINKIKWLPQTCRSQFMLATNDRAIKLFKLHEKHAVVAKGLNLAPQPHEGQEPAERPTVSKLRVPQLEESDSMVVATPKRLFAADIHKFNIHSLCVNSDGETFLSADNLTINQWHMDHTRLAFNLVNIKPEDMSKLTEVITCAETDSRDCHSFMYATNKGVVRMGDLRERAVNDMPPRVLLDPALDGNEGPPGVSAQQRPFLAEMLRSVSDIKYAQGGTGRNIVARDYMSVKIWDAAMEKRPVETIQVHDYLSSKLLELFENEYMYDCFDVSISPMGDILTGSYHNFFHVYDMNTRSDTLIEASKPPISTTSLQIAPHALGGPADRSSKALSGAANSPQPKKKRNSRPGLGSLLGRKKKSKDGKNSQSGLPEDLDVHMLNYDNRVMQLAWHPGCDAIATASNNNLYLYSRPKRAHS